MGIGQRIADILITLVGWKLDQPKAFTALMGGVTGVIVTVHPQADEGTRQAANMLVSALNDEGIDAKLQVQGIENNPKNNKINLSVGEKPR